MSDQKLKIVVSQEHPELSVSPDVDNGHTSVRGQAGASSEGRMLGVAGTVFLIVNSMVGTGIFSTPSSIFAATGSVGASLVLWLVGGVLALSGLSVYLEFGLAIPRSGGEKNYLERVYRRPRFLATCVLAARFALLGSSAANALSFGRYVLRAAGRDAGDWAARAIAIACASAVVLVHAVHPRGGVWLSNVLGAAKIAALVFIVCAGFAALAGRRRAPDPRNFDDAFAAFRGPGYAGGGAYAYANALLSVAYSYSGWDMANYVVGELRQPRRTLAVAAPLAVGGVTALYLLANVAYFAAIPKQDMATSGVLVAGIFFREMFGDGAAAHTLPALVALSNIGNVFATAFSYARFHQELGREGLLPFSRLWASSKPFNAPAAALLWHWLVTVVVLVAPPPGPAYNFIVNLSAYPDAWIKAFVVAGLIWLQHSRSERWISPWHTVLPASVVYFLSNLFLLVVPFVPPQGNRDAGGYAYYVFPVVGVAVLLSGVAYWALWTRVLPYLGGYRVVSERTLDEDGVEVVRCHRVRQLRNRWPSVVLRKMN